MPTHPPSNRRRYEQSSLRALAAYGFSRHRSTLGSWSHLGLLERRRVGAGMLRWLAGAPTISTGGERGEVEDRHHQCPLCDCERGLNGAHLLQCPNLPAGLVAARDQLRAGEPVADFARRVLRCEPSDWSRKGLQLASKIMKVAQRAAQASTPPSSPRSDVAGEKFLV